MSTAGPAPHRDDHPRRPADPGPLGPRAGRRLEPGREAPGLRGARAVPPDAHEPLRAGPRLALPPRALSLRHPGFPRGPRHGADPVRRLPGPDGAAVRAGDRRLPRGDAARRAERRDLQRPGPGLRAGRLPGPGRPGAAIGPELPGQPLDVPGRRGGRASAAHPPPAPGARVGRRALPDPGRADARAAGPLAQRLVGHLLPRHGLSRRRPGAEHLGRPGRPRPRRPPRPADRDAGCGSSPSRSSA